MLHVEAIHLTGEREDEKNCGKGERERDRECGCDWRRKRTALLTPGALSLMRGSSVMFEIDESNWSLMRKTFPCSFGDQETRVVVQDMTCCEE
jgi:hypothetical protein